MARRRGRSAPSDPQAIAARRRDREADQRAEARRVQRTPGEWGVSSEILTLESANDVDAKVGARGRIVSARRSDPFDLLHAAGGLTDHQHRAARRLFRLWCIAAGVRDQERLALDRVDGGRWNPSAGLVNDVMIDARATIGRVTRACGLENAEILRALIDPMVVGGMIIAWRGTIERKTGETDRHAQGSVVRRACENLRLAFMEDDARPRPRRNVAGAGSDFQETPGGAA